MKFHVMRYYDEDKQAVTIWILVNSIGKYDNTEYKALLADSMHSSVFKRESRVLSSSIEYLFQLTYKATNSGDK